MKNKFEQLSFEDMQIFLNEKHDYYNQPWFIETDPIQIAHEFTRKEDIEIISFLTAQIAWGNRKMIIKNSRELISLLEFNPYDFIMNAGKKELLKMQYFKHRTFNGIDLIFFIQSLKNIYEHHKGLEFVFTKGYTKDNRIFSAISYFRDIFFEMNHEIRSEKHIANVKKKSAAKRINLFLMWMVRNDKRGVHFGLWKNILPSSLMLPLDVHVSRTARMLGILRRKQNDWQAVEEVTSALKKFDPADPVKYDFALFGLGAFEKFNQ